MALFKFLRALILFFHGVLLPGSHADRPIGSSMHRAAGSVNATADAGGFLSVQVAVGLIEQEARHKVGLWSTRKGTTDSVASSTGGGDFNMVKVFLEK